VQEDNQLVAKESSQQRLTTAEHIDNQNVMSFSWALSCRTSKVGETWKARWLFDPKLPKKQKKATN
jgi:hypothetical protein